MENVTLKSLSQKLYFDVAKKSNSSTIVSQVAVADYAHASKSISFSNSKKYTVGLSGIVLNGINTYYSNMNYAKATWSGSW